MIHDAVREAVAARLADFGATASRVQALLDARPGALLPSTLARLGLDADRMASALERYAGALQTADPTPDRSNSMNDDTPTDAVPTGDPLSPVDAPTREEVPDAGAVPPPATPVDDARAVGCSVPPPPDAPESCGETLAPRPWEGPFLEALKARGNVTEACRAVRLSRQAAYQLAERHPNFKAAWEEAQQVAWDRMEAELYRRAVEGVDEPVFFGGEPIGTIKRYSDPLLLAGVKAHRPEYRDKQSVEVSGPAGAPIRTQAEIQAQLAPYAPAVELLVDSLIALRQLEAASASAPTLPAPAGPEVIDVEAVPPSTPAAPVGKPCPRGDKPGENPYCPVCHGAGVLPVRLT